MRALYFICFLTVVLPVFCSSNYSEDIAKDLMQCAGASYCKNADQLNLTCGPHCDYLDTQGYRVFYTEKIHSGFLASESFTIYHSELLNRIVLAFRGTSNPIQLLEEVSHDGSVPYAFQDNLPSGARIQSYFYDKYLQLLRDTVLSHFLIAKQNFPNAEIFVTGHSLGGAYAILCSFDLVSSGHFKKEELQVYTFGSPRLGNYEFAQAFDTLGPVLNRVLHYRDIVPHLPPCVSQGGECAKNATSPDSWNPYHPNQEIFYMDEEMTTGNFKVCLDEDNSCADSFIYIDIHDHHYYFGMWLTCPGDKDSIFDN